jgi:hypothetical protein
LVLLRRQSHHLRPVKREVARAAPITVDTEMNQGLAQQLADWTASEFIG